ncbi:N-acyl homoserine lactonase family protein [Rhodohalobacter mucosus]|uniref:N-acyl homoserine lactonase family protein n=1 Tax=Rhodohalobacter mucosus TaxID=2079485 RepID=A0A316TR85_9BACT|nr:N-acyl homoserine lactonase family protein [Rhodohalobacter mucosus]PWN06201.1 N-acyl homoserine lactonase family protein [Rhodohalobacter mucosus]
MEIFPLQTGSVKVKKAQKSREKGGMLRVLTSEKWTDWLPIYAWLIKHPEGTFVVDTGETSLTSRSGYFPKWHPYYRYAVKMDVSRDDEIDRQLARYNVDSKDVDKVILTHFHTDHAGGLYHFSNSDILVPKSEYQNAKGTIGKLRGYLPQHWKDWFKPDEIEFKKQNYGPFAESYPVTKDGSIMAVPTPGHTPGHLSVVADTGDKKVFLAGDTSYTEQLLINLQPDGVTPDTKQSLDTQMKILKLAEQGPVIYLPSHDPEASRRLSTNKTLAV